MSYYFSENSACFHAQKYHSSGLYFEPYGKNGGIVDDEFNRGAKDGSPWCSTLLLKCFEKADSPICSSKEWWSLRSVRNLRDFAYAQGKFHFALAGVAPNLGDLAIFCKRGRSDSSTSKDAWHVGIVVRRAVGGDHFETIDGNWGNRIAKVTRSTRDRTLVGYARFEGAA